MLLVNHSEDQELQLCITKGFWKPLVKWRIVYFDKLTSVWINGECSTTVYMQSSRGQFWIVTFNQTAFAEQKVSKCGPWTGSTSSIWKLVRNAKSWALSSTSCLSPFRLLWMKWNENTISWETFITHTSESWQVQDWALADLVSSQTLRLIDSHLHGGLTWWKGQGSFSGLLQAH